MAEIKLEVMLTEELKKVFDDFSDQLKSFEENNNKTIDFVTHLLSNLDSRLKRIENSMYGHTIEEIDNSEDQFELFKGND